MINLDREVVFLLFFLFSLQNFFFGLRVNIEKV